MPTGSPPVPYRRIISAVIASIVALAAIPTTFAQVDYFWIPPTGGPGTWDTSTVNWSTVAAGPVSTVWPNTGGERANFGNTLGAVTLGANINAYGINFTTTGYSIAGGGFALTLTGPGGPITTNVAATISAPIAGTVGLTRSGTNTLTLSGANTYTGGTTVTGGGTLLGIAQAGASPFGAATGPMTLNFATLRLNSIAATTTTTVGNFTVGAASATATGTANLIVDNTNGGVGVTTTFAAGNLLRGGAGSALVITPVTGSLGTGTGTGEAVTFANGNALLTNTILPPWVVATASGTNLAADFVTHGANGVAVATYFGGDLTTSTSTSVVNQTTSPTVTAPVAAYALKTNQVIALGGNTLTLGNGTGQTGLILNNGGSITGGPVSFGPTEGLVYAQGTTTLGAGGDTVTSNGLTITALGAANLTLGGTIADGAQPAKLILTGVTTGTSITLGGPNTYTGGTTLSVQTGGTGNIFIGNDSAFGTGKVTNILVPGTSSPQFQATGGLRTLANAFDLNGGLAFTGTNGFVFTGPITVINAAAGGTRTLNAATGTTATVTFGTSGSPSTITLGNPVANGGDGVGKAVVFSPAAASVFVVNDVMQDPAAGGGSGSGSVQYAGTAGGVTQVNSLSTYTGPTVLNGASTVQFNHNFNTGDPSGPFGLGTLVFNNTTNNILQPVGGNRTIANPISLVFGFTISNATGDTSSLTFTGPIALTTNGRTLTNNFTATGGILTLGSAASPSTFTLASTTGQTVVIGGTGTTVINDVIQNSPGISTIVNVTGAGSVNFNAQNTFNGGVTLTGAGTIIPITVSSNALPGASFTSGPFGTGQVTFNNGTNQHLRPVGNQTISNALLLTTGFAMDTAVGDTTSSLTFAGPITMTNNRFISNGFVVGQAGGTLILGAAAAPSTITLPVSSTFTLSLAALNGPIVVNDVLQNATGQTDNVSINPNGGDTNTVTLNAVNTYTGTTTIGGGAIGGGTVAIGSNQPFGTGTLVMNNTASTSGTPPTLQPVGADRTIANPISMTSGFFASSAPGAPFNLTLTGPIAISNNRLINNTMVSGATLTLGSAATPSTITLGVAAGQQLQFQSTTGTGTTVVNDVIQDPTPGVPGSVLVTSGTVRLTNANTYSGTTGVTGGTLVVNNATGSGAGTSTVTVTGAGTGAAAVGTGGTLGGTGTIAGPTAIGSAAAGSQGGIVYPGPGGSSAGTLNVGGMTWNPFGQYVFAHSATSTAVGGGVNNLINGTGILDLSNLGNIDPTTPSATPFDLRLLPVNFSATPTQQTYTIANFSGGITGTVANVGGSPIANLQDISNLFTLSGAFTSASAPYAMVVAGTGGPQAQAIQLTFTPVPEPAFVLAVCGGLTALATWRKRRRN